MTGLFGALNVWKPTFRRFVTSWRAILRLTPPNGGLDDADGFLPVARRGYARAKHQGARRMTKRRERIAFQCWWLIQSTAGECTLADMAEFTGARKTECAQICARKGWATMYRKTSTDYSTTAKHQGGTSTYLDASLDALMSA
jgi:hypothetical protein